MIKLAAVLDERAKGKLGRDKINEGEREGEGEEKRFLLFSPPPTQATK